MSVQELLQEALTVKGKIKRIEDEVLSDLKDSLKQISEKLMREMEAEGARFVEDSLGDATIVERRGSVKIDKEAVMEALELENLDDYSSEGKPSKFLKFTLTKKSNG